MSTPNDAKERLGLRLTPGLAGKSPTQGQVTPHTALRRLIESRMPPQVVGAMTTVRLSKPTDLLSAVYRGEEPIERLGEVITMLRTAADTLEAGLANATHPCPAPLAEA